MLFVLLYPTQNKSYVMLCYLILTKREIPKVFTEVNLNGNNDNDDDNNDDDNNNNDNDNNSSNNLKQNYDFQINASVKSYPIQYH